VATVEGVEAKKFEIQYMYGGGGETLETRMIKCKLQLFEIMKGK
jgi:hypothetical protein